MTEIRLRNIEKRFGDVTVIEGLDLTIHGREFFTFVGPSGCGKSTLLNLIAGLEDITSGEILFDGTDVSRLSPSERDVAMVFQSYALYPHMTVFENIAFPLRVRKRDEDTISSEVRRVAGLLGLEGLLTRLPRELSGGQRQRVALGRAIVRRPRVFLMDEPLSNLDARLRVDMRAELKKLHRELGITTVYVTHDQEEALSLSHRVAVLLDGRIQQVGPPAELFEKPATTFVATFIGSPSMNLLEGSIMERRPLRIGMDDIVVSPTGWDIKIQGKVILGIRPEDVVVSTEPLTDGFTAEVEVVEPVGSTVWVDIVRGGMRLRARMLKGMELEPGAQVFFRFDPAKFHLFDPSTERRL